MKTSGALPVTGKRAAPKECSRKCSRIVFSRVWGTGGHRTPVRRKVSYPTLLFPRQESQLQRQLTKKGDPKAGGRGVLAEVLAHCVF